MLLVLEEKVVKDAPGNTKLSEPIDDAKYKKGGGLHLVANITQFSGLRNIYLITLKLIGIEIILNN